MDVTQVPELIEKTGYPLLVDSYDEAPKVYQSLCQVLPVTDDVLYGEKSQTITGMGRFIEREDGAEVQADEFRSAYTWRLKTRQFSRRLDIPERMWRASDAAGRIQNMVGEMARSFGMNAALQKDDHVAGMFQKGTLTAGSVPYFDGSFPNETDTSPGLIYDALPWFDTAHTISVGSSTFANHTVSSALSKTNLESTLTTIRSTNNRDERNERIMLRPDTLVVPPALEYTARTILESSQLPGTAQNDVNTSRGALDLVVWDALTDDTDAWWIVQRSMGSGVRVRDSGAPIMRIHFDELKKTFHVIFEYHFGAAVTNWRFAYNCNKAAS